ncbi:hypothetical protein GQ44DRAFT_727350 [Phaeosphaeriaceae sp. PMI808]|nr:hypothetical protein GQ44DRAFT_727350 [Phaeosphaeriaceae sp. PMI808]
MLSPSTTNTQSSAEKPTPKPYTENLNLPRSPGEPRPPFDPTPKPNDTPPMPCPLENYCGPEGCFDPFIFTCCPGSKSTCRNGRICTQKSVDGTVWYGCEGEGSTSWHRSTTASVASMDSATTTKIPSTTTRLTQRATTSAPSVSKTNVVMHQSIGGTATPGRFGTIMGDAMMSSSTVTGSMSINTAAPLKLWFPSASSKIRPSKLFIALLSLIAVAVAHILPQPGSTIANSMSYTITTSATPSVTPSFNLRPSYIFSPPPNSGIPLECPDDLERCGQVVCYNYTTQICCPGKQNICEKGETCASAQRSDGEMVYGCAPAGVTDGLDPRIRTSVSSESQNLTTSASKSASTSVTQTATNSTVGGATSATTTASPSKPTKNGGMRFAVPWPLQYAYFFMNGVRAFPYPSQNYRDCCGDLCCGDGEVCARSSTGAKCWPQVSNLRTRDNGIAGVDTIDWGENSPSAESKVQGSSTNRNANHIV